MSKTSGLGTPETGALTATCASCKKRYQVRGDVVGIQVPCPTCNKMLDIQRVSPADMAAKMRVICPGCKRGIQAGKHLIGKPIKCPGCAHAFTVAAEPAAPVPAPARPLPTDETLAAPGANADTEEKGERGGEPSTEFLAPAQAPDEMGRLGQYRVLRVLGHGGMGVVFRAEDPMLQRPVALKVMLPAVAARPQSRQRFLREARAAAALRHPHVITIYQVGEDRGVPFLAMEFLEGEPLDARLRGGGKVPVPDAVRIARQAADGLAAAHAQGLIHRDIKPANIWLERKEESRRKKDDAGPSSMASALHPAPLVHVKILDFGLARGAQESENLTQSGAVMGTPAYMAPEQARSAAVDGRADLFSLGCVLYHMLAGRQPFTGNDVYSILLALATTEPEPPHVCDASIPRPLSDLVMRLLAKDPQKRPTAEVFLDALDLVSDDGTLELSGARTRPVEPGAGKVRAVATLAARHGWASARWLAPRVWAGGKFVVIPRPGESGLVKAARFAALPAALLFMVLGLWGVARAFMHVTGLRGARPVAANTPVDTEDPRPPAGPRGELPKLVTNAVDMKLVLLPKGSFKMGSPAGEKDRAVFEDPHEVDIAEPFYLGTHEVTQAQFQKVMGRNPSTFSTTGAGRAKVNGLDTGLLPVESVSWKDAVEFCEKLSVMPEEKREGRVYRLPTEAEWEYACRAARDTVQPTQFGRLLSSYDANFNGNFPYGDTARGPFLARPAPVGSYPANALGLFDMHGNVAEWCADLHDGICLTGPNETPITKPVNPRARGLRGGSWSEAGRGCRTAGRIQAETDERSPFWGFRVALTVPQ